VKSLGELVAEACAWMRAQNQDRMGEEVAADLERAHADAAAPTDTDA
jgi:hypothetical protein